MDFDEAIEEILNAPIRTWEDSAKRAFVFVIRHIITGRVFKQTECNHIRQAALESMRAYSRNPTNLGVLGIWIYSWNFVHLDMWMDRRNKTLPNASVLDTLLCDIMKRKKPADDVEWQNEWSWIPEGFKVVSEEIKEVIAKKVSDIKEQDSSVYRMAIGDLDIMVREVGMFGRRCSMK